MQKGCGSFLTKTVVYFSLSVLSGCTSASLKKNPLTTALDPEHIWKPTVRIISPETIEKPTFEPQTSYSLPKLIELGLSKNPQTRVAWWSAQKALSQAERAKAPFFPSAKATLSGTRTRAGALSGKEGSTTDTWGPGLMVAYKLFQFGADKANAESAACALAAANYQFNYALQTAVFSIQTRYYQYAAAVTAIEARRSSLEDAENSLKNAEDRMQNGLGRSQAVLLAKAEKLQAEYELIAAEAALEQCRAELALAVGVPVSKEFQIEVTFNDFEPLTKDVQTLLEDALKRRADVLAQKTAVQASERAHFASERSRLPSIELGGELNRLHYNSPKEPRWQNNYRVTIGLSWNFFDGFDKQYKALEQYAELKKQRFALQQQQLQVLHDVWTEFHAFQSAVQLLTAAKALETAALEALNASRSGYESGLNDILDVLSAQKNLSEARLKRTQSQASLATHWAQLAYVSGRLNSEVSNEPTEEKP